MRLGRNRAQTPATAARFRPATFKGFTEPVPYLYEFRTSEGQYISLHEMDCVNIQFAPMSRRLELVFECASSEVMEHPLTLTLNFDEAKVHQWLDDATDDTALTSAANAERVRGQVTDLVQVGEAAFSLRLLDVRLDFEARSVACTVRPGLASPSTPDA